MAEVPKHVGPTDVVVNSSTDVNNIIEATPPETSGPKPPKTPVKTSKRSVPNYPSDEIDAVVWSYIDIS